MQTIVSAVASLLLLAVAPVLGQMGDASRQEAVRDFPRVPRSLISAFRVRIQFLSLDGCGRPMRRTKPRKRADERMESNSGAVRTNSIAGLCSS